MPATRTVEVVTADGPMALYEARPDDVATPARGAIVLQEAFGVNGYIEDVTRRLATQGYLAVAPHVYHRSGDPVFGYDDYSDVPRHVEALGDPGILADVDASVDHLEHAGIAAAAIGVVGFCMGGRATFLTATSRALGAAVTFYGAAIVTGRSKTVPALVDRVASLATPWLGLFGEEDPSIPLADLDRLRSELDTAATVAWDIVTYLGAGHGFHCDQRDAYRAGPAADAWARTLAFFDQHLP